MPAKLIITRDFDHMSEVASRLLVENIRETLAAKGRYVLGLATGNTPTGLYKHLAKAANGGQFDSSKIVSFNLDEYIGLPGENAQQRALHRESYSFFMIQELFGLLHKKFAETSVPWGTLVDQDRLESEMKAHPADWTAQGTQEGEAIVISRDAQSEYLQWIRAELLDAYETKIERAGGIDLHVVGVGGKGHVGFHEAGIPFEDNNMLLVKLDEGTIAHAVEDGHFASREDSPLYAISMGVSLIYKARTVMLLANGERKADVLARAFCEEVGPAVPFSYSQAYAKQGGQLVGIIDKQAARGVLERAKEIQRRGAEIEDVSDGSASISVEGLHFFRHADTCLMG